MTRCCDWRPDPTVFGPCPHCRPAAPQRRPVTVVGHSAVLHPWASLADLTQGANP